MPRLSILSRQNYYLLALVNALGWGVAAGYYGLTAEGIAAAVLFSISLMITVIDIKHYIIPDSLVILLLITGIIFQFAMDTGLSTLNRMIGLGLGFGVPFFLAIFSKGGIGGGDIKLCAVFGYWLGIPGIFYALFIGALLASLTGIILIILKKKKRKDPIPFGPFLVLGFLTAYFGG